MPEPEIKLLMKRLGESINETLADSPKINERIQEIRDAGYEVFLVIEAKIGFSRTGRGKGILTRRLQMNPSDCVLPKKTLNFLNH